MTRSVKLRPWQKRAVEAFVASDRSDFLAVATPGAGKTTFALTALRLELGRSGWRRVCIVVPTAHLKAQWAAAAARFDLHLEPEWSSADGALPADLDGVVVTYQQVAANPAALAPLVAGGLAVFDELHHAADDRAWGDGVRVAFEGAHRRLALSGTPFRSDTAAIPFVRYRLEEAEADFEYGYADALADRRVVRPVYFPRVGGHMEWSAPDGTLYEATFDDPLARALANQRLRTALSLEGEWLPAVLSQANAELQRLRRSTQPDAGGLVIAMDVDHARGIARLLRDRLGSAAVVATSDDPDASDRIARFAASTAPWIVAVRMVSEGVDIPRLRVGVFATNTTTELFFRQAVGRFVRWQPIVGAGRQKAFLFIPDDIRLRTFAHQIADQRRHSLRRKAEDAASDDPAPPDEAALDALGEPEQLSLFAALSATPLDVEEVSVFDDGSGADEPGDEVVADESLEVALAPLQRPVPGPGAAGPAQGGPGGAGDDTAGLDPRAARERLRDLNAAVVAQVALVTGRTHAQVNAELNRMVGIRRITEATSAQLQRRVEAGRAWLDRARRSTARR